MKNLILLIIVIIFSSCAKEDDKKTNFVRTPDNTVLEGTWKTSCLTSGSYTAFFYITIDGSKAEYKQEWHNGAGCSTDSWTIIDSYENFTVGLPVTFTDNTSGYYLYSVVDSSKETTLSSSTNNSYNSASYCGYSDWVVNTEKDVTGKTCNSIELPIKGTEYYSISRLIGTSLQVSLFSTSDFPTSVQTFSYTKQ